RLETVDAAGRVAGDDPIASAAAALIAGRIVAVKGLGGFHLACDAGNADAVAMLRTRKHRDEKPFAVMVGDVGTAALLCEMSAAEAAVLQSAARPIMLLQRHSTYVGSGFSRTGARPEVCEHVAPQSNHLGVMLPYTPVHHLLMSSIGRRA